MFFLFHAIHSIELVKDVYIIFSLQKQGGAFASLPPSKWRPWFRQIVIKIKIILFFLNYKIFAPCALNSGLRHASESHRHEDASGSDDELDLNCLVALVEAESHCTEIPNTVQVSFLLGTCM